MKHPKVLLLFFISLIFPLNANAYEADCAYSLGNGYDAHCTFVSAPNEVQRYLEVIFDDQMAMTSCVDNTILPFSFSKEMIGKGDKYLISFGTHTLVLNQCKTIDCSSKKLIGTDQFIVGEDKIVSPNKFSIVIDPNFGENCPTVKTNPEDMIMVTLKQLCNKLPYCITITNPPEISKYVKIVNGTDNAITYCLNSQLGFGFNKTASKGEHTIQFYQCDNIECNKPKLIGSEKITISPDGAFDHKKDSISLDPSYGDDCKIRILNR